jgi:hypothetical protein
MNPVMSLPSPSHRAEGILNAALERDLAEREAFLIDACAGDAAPLAEVRALLAAHEAMPIDFLAVSPVEGIPESDLEVTLKNAVGSMLPVRPAAVAR